MIFYYSTTGKQHITANHYDATYMHPCVTLLLCKTIMVFKNDWKSKTGVFSPNDCAWWYTQDCVFTPHILWICNALCLIKVYLKIQCGLNYFFIHTLTTYRLFSTHWIITSLKCSVHLWEWSSAVKSAEF